MKKGERIVNDKYVDIDYHQFNQSSTLKLAMRVAGILTWPIIIPIALLSRISDFIFITNSQLLSLIPYLIGTIVRYEFYRFTLTRCGENVMIGFGTVFLYRDIEIGDNVLFGMFNTIHYCDYGSYVLIADGCRFLSGSKYHNYDEIDKPIALQGGKLKRINIESNVWIGTNAIIMESVQQGSIIGAGSVVNKPIEPNVIVAGNPARVIRPRS